MSVFLERSIVNEIIRLKEKGYTYRYLAKSYGMSPGTVLSLCKNPNRYIIEYSSVTKPIESNNQGPFERCPDCKYKVQMPCRICKTRRFANSKRLLKLARIW